jgi:hypothetical protein
LGYVRLRSSGEIVKGLIHCNVGAMKQVLEINNIILSFLDVSLDKFMWINLLLTSFFILLFLKFLLDSLLFSFLFHLLLFFVFFLEMLFLALKFVNALFFLFG